mmetsp:Transcript_40508/g.39010  ORF Transcript_40508/g.39010 Transcript_40508/m.39010 type:complete len:107 (+) Transcript_40508:124-444(+)
MGSILVVNYADFEDMYLKLSENEAVMYINCTTFDGNITFVEENFGPTHYYELRNVFFKTPAETVLNDVRYDVEVQMFHVNPLDEEDMAIVSVVFDSSLDLDNTFMA